MRGPWDMSKKGFFPILIILIFRVKNGQKRPKNQCLSVCPEATGHNFLLGNIIFGMRGPWDMSKKVFFRF